MKQMYGNMRGCTVSCHCDGWHLSWSCSLCKSFEIHSLILKSWRRKRKRQWVQKRVGEGREGVECQGIGRSDKMWQWAHWLAGWLLLYTPITQSPCPPRHFNLIPRPKETRAQLNIAQRKAREERSWATVFHVHSVPSTYVDGSLISTLKWLLLLSLHFTLYTECVWM